MTNHEYNLIICTLALDSEDTVEQILQEMQATIYHLFTQLPRTPEMQALVGRPSDASPPLPPTGQHRLILCPQLASYSK